MTALISLQDVFKEPELLRSCPVTLGLGYGHPPTSSATPPMGQ